MISTESVQSRVVIDDGRTHDDLGRLVVSYLPQLVKLYVHTTYVSVMLRLLSSIIQ